ncbi:CD320 antigen isoform X2 [Erythrolamprus reginae]|uniref:CD320 antigen isoform X2 n=1 Tax=Erythrolamprus reginae TaxID=121349 RepID=UPI00396CB19A
MTRLLLLLLLNWEAGPPPLPETAALEPLTITAIVDVQKWTRWPWRLLQMKVHKSEYDEIWAKWRNWIGNKTEGRWCNVKSHRKNKNCRSWSAWWPQQPSLCASGEKPSPAWPGCHSKRPLSSSSYTKSPEIGRPDRKWLFPPFRRGAPPCPLTRPGAPGELSLDVGGSGSPPGTPGRKRSPPPLGGIKIAFLLKSSPRVSCCPRGPLAYFHSGCAAWSTPAEEDAEKHRLVKGLPRTGPWARILPERGGRGGAASFLGVGVTLPCLAPPAALHKSRGGCSPHWTLSI